MFSVLTRLISVSFGSRPGGSQPGESRPGRATGRLPPGEEGGGAAERAGDGHEVGLSGARDGHPAPIQPFAPLITPFFAAAPHDAPPMLHCRITLSETPDHPSRPPRTTLLSRDDSHPVAGARRFHSASRRTRPARRMPKEQEKWGSRDYLSERLSDAYQRFRGVVPLMCHEKFIVWSR